MLAERRATLAASSAPPSALHFSPTPNSGLAMPLCGHLWNRDARTTASGGAS